MAAQAIAKPKLVGKRIPRACSYSIIVAPSDLLFEPSGRKSPYLQALQELVKAGPGKLLCFDNPGARPSIWAVAKKHGIKIMFAIKDGKLYARLQDVNGPESALLQFLKDGPRGIADIEIHLKGLGIDANTTGLLADLSRNNKIQLISIGGGKRWKAIE